MRFTITAAVLGLVASSTAERISRRPDSFWEHIVKGADIQSAQAASHPSYLADYQMRVKAVNPSSLGIDSVKQISGYLDDNANDKHLFFWLFNSRNNPATDPVILWLNGGPGCSSMTGLFREIGPVRIPNIDLDFVINPYPWNLNATVIFLDQPVNVGFSYSKNSTITGTPAAARDVYSLLTLFFNQYPEYAKQAFHLTGESYAGHYIPQFAHEILKHPASNINLKSIAMGNPLVDVYTQFQYYQPMACGQGDYPAVINETRCQQMKDDLPGCLAEIQSCYDTDANLICSKATQDCDALAFNAYLNTGLSLYDVRKTVVPGGNFDTYLNQPKVKNAIGAEVMDFILCNYDMYNDFVDHGDLMRRYSVADMPPLLAKIPALVYAGDADYICNWLGNRAWTDALKWPGKAAFGSATLESLKLKSGKAYGTIKHARGLAFARIFASSHFVPEDKPEASLDLINRWLHSNEWHD